MHSDDLNAKVLQKYLMHFNGLRKATMFEFINLLNARN